MQPATVLPPVQARSGGTRQVLSVLRNGSSDQRIERKNAAESGELGVLDGNLPSQAIYQRERHLGGYGDFPFAASTAQPKRSPTGSHITRRDSQGPRFISAARLRRSRMERLADPPARRCGRYLQPASEA